MSQPILDLVRNCLRGDQNAMVSLVEELHPIVYAVCFRLLGHRHDAEDAVQETFTRLFRHLKQWDQSRPLEPWLLTIAGNRCRTMLARRKRQPKVDGAIDMGQWVADEADHSDNLREELERSLGGLRDEHRQAFLLFHRDHLSYAEISTALDCPLGTVKTWVHRARLHIIKELQQREALEVSRRAV